MNDYLRSRFDGLDEEIIGEVLRQVELTRGLEREEEQREELADIIRDLSFAHALRVFMATMTREDEQHFYNEQGHLLTAYLLDLSALWPAEEFLEIIEGQK